MAGANTDHNGHFKRLNPKDGFKKSFFILVLILLFISNNFVFILLISVESFHRSICLWKYPKSTLRLRKISLNHIFKMNLIKKR